MDCAASTNYSAATGLPPGAFVINKATPTATLAVTNSPVVYDGSPHAAAVGITVSSVPGSVGNILTGGAATQTNVGTYAVTADFVPTDTTNYNTVTGLSAGNFIIENAPKYSLSVSKTGTGSGTVTSNPAGIACGATCAADFDYNTLVTLMATPATDSFFSGWNGRLHGHRHLRGDHGRRQERDGELHAQNLHLPSDCDQRAITCNNSFRLLSEAGRGVAAGTSVKQRRARPIGPALRRHRGPASLKLIADDAFSQFPASGFQLTPR